MTAPITELTVEAPGGSYPIFLGRNLREKIRTFSAELAEAGRASAMLTDTGVAAAWSSGLPECPTMTVPAGERSKSVAELARIWSFLADKALDRRSVLWAVGGGVVGDLGGFAAASYLRGIDFVQAPTTLLAMVDSSVGGKTGINLPEGKNLVGAFHQPIAVLADLDALATLPPREFDAGMAEVIKYGLLADADLFSLLASRIPVSPVDPKLPEIVARCCAIKAAIVRADERETARDGGRALLNLGHTFAHAIENVAGYGEYLHGEAVGIGLVLASWLSRELGYLGPDDVARTEQIVARQGLPIRLRTPLAVNALLDVMTRDKKAQQGRPRFIVLRKIGQAAVEKTVEPSLVERLWREAGAS